MQAPGQASALDPRTQALIYLAALRLESSVPFHVKAAKVQEASHEEASNALLVGMPAACHLVTQVLPAAPAVSLVIKNRASK